MKFERDWDRQGSSRRRLEDGLRELCRVAFAGVGFASIEYIPPAAKRLIRRITPCSIRFADLLPDNFDVLITSESFIQVGFQENTSL